MTPEQALRELERVYEIDRSNDDVDPVAIIRDHLKLTADYFEVISERDVWYSRFSRLMALCRRHIKTNEQIKRVCNESEECNDT